MESRKEQGAGSSQNDNDDEESGPDVIPGNYEMPDFIGQLGTDAVGKLVDDGFTGWINYVDVETGESPSVFTGWTVERQHPEPGVMIDIDQNDVTLYMREGEAPVT
ncbi:beta-lactam-binding protein with PASTA domain [Trueperella bonasi]|uniref:Beta-lactam-binding protein with PASTA domain n=1 Tax=Trueperella bonasi TaxID=312286 RepID=A0ABT9NDL7_9ACTO|nr:PASTA domain-containing protein [Trueperella bonasi]MDP9805471.1 beta-lactam-binding protein with PASTA domain [Trueperella bonasi]